VAGGKDGNKGRGKGNVGKEERQRREMGAAHP